MYSYFISEMQCSGQWKFANVSVTESTSCPLHHSPFPAKTRAANCTRVQPFLRDFRYV